VPVTPDRKQHLSHSNIILNYGEAFGCDDATPRLSAPFNKSSMHGFFGWKNHLPVADAAIIREATRSGSPTPALATTQGSAANTYDNAGSFGQFLHATPCCVMPLSASIPKH
jgi:hypothetical protein